MFIVTDLVSLNKTNEPQHATITDYRHSMTPRGKLYLQISKFVSITLYLFSYPSVKTCVLGAQKDHLIETVLLTANVPTTHVIVEK